MQWCNGAVRAVVKCSSAWYAMLCSGVVLYSAVLCNNAIHAVVKWSS
jgi:hypothetical protein